MHFILHELLRGLIDHAGVRTVFLVAELAALASLPSVLLGRRGRPLAALAWILALVALPVLGVLGWWTVGRTHLRRLVRRRRRTTHAAWGDRPRDGESPDSPALAAVLPFASAADREDDGVFAPKRGNAVDLLVDGREAFPAFHEAIAGAREEVSCAFFVWRADETGRRLLGALIAAARRGVRVRLLVDGVGSLWTPRRFFRPLREAGGEVAWFLPLGWPPWQPTFNFRNHRKLLVVDRQVGFTGGMNVGAEYEHDWHDLAVRVRGPLVTDLLDVFLEDWAFATGGSWAAGAVSAPAGEAVGAVLASGPDRIHERAHDALFLAITEARERAWLTSPYFVPSPGILDALRTAAWRGVDVALLLPRSGDSRLVELASRPYLPLVAEAGVRVLLRHDRMVHAKALTVDGRLAAVGSANVDNRSFRLHFELTCFFDSPPLAARLEEVFRTGERASQPYVPTPDEGRLPQRLLEAVAHLASPLL